MGLTERIKSAVDTSAEIKFNKVEYTTNAIKERIYTSDDELANQNPVQFIFKYINASTIENAIKVNPAIKAILEENGLPVSYNLENAVSIIASHLIPTARTAKRMYAKMGATDPQKASTLYKAALLHDIGKVFIPSEILNKNGKLSPRERETIELHNKLSYEILKTTDVGSDVAKLTYEHHDYENNLERTPENQALTISDVYCALREKRPYKKANSDFVAKTILYDMGTKGKFDAGYIKYIN